MGFDMKGFAPAQQPPPYGSSTPPAAQSPASMQPLPPASAPPVNSGRAYAAPAQAPPGRVINLGQFGSITIPSFGVTPQNLPTNANGLLTAPPQAGGNGMPWTRRAIPDPSNSGFHQIPLPGQPNRSGAPAPGGTPLFQNQMVQQTPQALAAALQGMNR